MDIKIKENTIGVDRDAVVNVIGSEFSNVRYTMRSMDRLALAYTFYERSALKLFLFFFIIMLVTSGI